MANKQVFLGIDPGANGGLAAIWPDGSVKFKTMPDTDEEILEWVQLDGGDYSDFKDGPIIGLFTSVAVIEHVTGYIGQQQPGSAMFNFGVSYGGLKMALVAAGTPFTEVRPQAWQKSLGIPKRTKLENRTNWKQRLKRKAEELFPDLHITLATADALLLAYYCKQLHGG